ncbi:MAG: hypothetical protein GWO04_39290, partial [Actinobacteria bacterium]|nr:hypothetical protein [Actinomycetota bacterium]
GAIEDLGGNERTLKPLKVELPQALDALVPDTELVDPERPVSPDRLTTDLVGDDLAQPETRTVVYRGLALLLL